MIEVPSLFIFSELAMSDDTVHASIARYSALHDSLRSSTPAREKQPRIVMRQKMGKAEILCCCQITHAFSIFTGRVQLSPSGHRPAIPGRENDGRGAPNNAAA
jgi:hypothetical protein